jgi:adenosine deaminase
LAIQITEDFVRDIPKTDLHVHLDGSLRLGTLVDLARSRKVSLPSWSEAGLRELVFKPHYADLGEYLQGFHYTTAVMQDREALEQVGYELALDCFAEGVRYIEVRFAPQLHVHADLGIDDVLIAVDAGLRRARSEINAAAAIASGAEPRFEYGIIVCALRMFTEQFSAYYRQLISAHRYARPREHFAMASLELARAAVAVRDHHELPIVGFDLAGQEDGYPADNHVRAYGYAQKNFLKRTVHAGEAYGPESIFQAITDLHADRIGHGYHLFSPHLVQGRPEAERNAYAAGLAQYIADRRITIEVCLTSNQQTMPHLRESDLSHHNLRQMLAAKLSVSLCTDNRLVSSTTVSQEILLAVHNFKMFPKQLKNVVIYGFKRSFFPGSYHAKRSYVRQIIDYYEQVEAAHAGGAAKAEPAGVVEAGAGVA